MTTPTDLDQGGNTFEYIRIYLGNTLGWFTFPTGLVPTGVNPQTPTTYTLIGFDNGAIIPFSNAAAITVTLPNNMPAGFSCILEQDGTGQITVAAGSGATMQSPGGANKSTQRYSMVFVVVISNNAALNAAAWRVGGDITV